MVNPLQTTEPLLQVWLDFVCPYCLLGEGIIMQATEGLEFDIQWMPFELRPFPNPTLRPEDEYLPRVWKQSVYPMAERMGIPISLPTVSPQPYSRLAFFGYQFARAQGKANAYVNAVLKAFFQKNLDIGSTDTLISIARDVGLPEHEFAHALHNQTYSNMHDAALNIAREKQIRAVPTIEVNGNRFEGVPSVLELRRVLEEARSNSV